MAATTILEKFQMAISPQPVVRSTSCLVIGWGFLVFGDGGSNGAIFDSNKLKMAAAAILDNFEWPYLRNGCLLDSLKPDSPKLGFRVRVSVSANWVSAKRVSANRD